MKLARLTSLHFSSFGQIKTNPKMPSTKDLHSGVYGGSVHEGMSDLIPLMASLVDNTGKILVDGVMKDVAPVTEDEKKIYEKIDFSLEDYAEETGVKAINSKLLHNTKESLLMHRWRFPTLSLHGIEGAFSDPGAKTVIPRKVSERSERAV